MPAQKRPLDESSSTKNAKKFRTNDTTKPLLTEEVDFPRGGGTTFTPLEVKAIRAEAVKEANAELFEVSQSFYSQRDTELKNSCSGY
jgi:rRNA biogenesis protein RRP5